MMINIGYDANNNIVSLGRSTAEEIAGYFSADLNEKELEELIAGLSEGKCYQLDVASGSIKKCETAESLNKMKVHKQYELNRLIDSRQQHILKLYPQSEVLTWPNQEHEAIAYLRDRNSPTPTLDAIISSMDGVDKEAFCEKILEKAQTYKASARLFGIRQKYALQIEAAVNVAALEAIEFNV